MVGSIASPAPTRPHRLAEPLDTLRGRLAREAIAAGVALPTGGDRATSLFRLIEPGRSDRILPAVALPAEWLVEVGRLSRPDAGLGWAGLGAAPAVMGVLNITPDSFSDGGERIGAATAITAGLRMIAAGAAILDIGGESTRPGAQTVPPEVEQARIVPVIAGLAGRGVPISVDTRNASTMTAALAAGATIVNDVTALRHDPAAASVVAAAGVPVILVHSRGTPQTMTGLRSYRDVVLDVLDALGERVEAAVASGIRREAIAVDPGIGFAKGMRENLAVLHRLPLFRRLGCRIVVGASRKAFIGRLSGVAEPSARIGGSLAVAMHAAQAVDAVLRVHDVTETAQALHVWQALSA